MRRAREGEGDRARAGAGAGGRGRVLLLFALDGKPLSKHAIPVEQCALGGRGRAAPVGHCGIKLLKRFRDNLSFRSVFLSGTDDSPQSVSNYFSVAVASFLPTSILGPVGGAARRGAGADDAVTIVNMAINVAIC